MRQGWRRICTIPASRGEPHHVEVDVIGVGAQPQLVVPERDDAGAVGEAAVGVHAMADFRVHPLDDAVDALVLGLHVTGQGQRGDRAQRHRAPDIEQHAREVAVVALLAATAPATRPSSVKPGRITASLSVSTFWRPAYTTEFATACNTRNATAGTADGPRRFCRQCTNTRAASSSSSWTWELTGAGDS
jgi:hypothetical protein